MEDLVQDVQRSLDAVYRTRDDVIQPHSRMTYGDAYPALPVEPHGHGGYAFA